MMETSNVSLSTSHTESRNAKDTMGQVLVSMIITVRLNVLCLLNEEWIAPCLQLVYVVVAVQNVEQTLLYFICKIEECLHLIGYWFDVVNAGGLLSKAHHNKLTLLPSPPPTRSHPPEDP